MEWSALETDHRQQRSGGGGQGSVEDVPGNVIERRPDQRRVCEKSERCENREQVDDSPYRYAAWIKTQAIKSIDAPFEVEHSAV